MSNIEEEIERLLGRVKWFNNKAGYGFITVTDGARSGTDVFVHHSAISVDSQQYKYLVQGEYVEFSLTKTTSEKHEWQASTINGIKGGKLMCETRREFKNSRISYEKDQTAERDTRQQRTPRVPRTRGEGPREGPRETDKKEWTMASNNAEKKPRGRPPRQSAASVTK